jgi:hypothetical protein
MARHNRNENPLVMRSRRIAIVKRPRRSDDIPDDLPSDTKKDLYEYSTWRMYNRIMDYRLNQRPDVPSQQQCDLQKLPQTLRQQNKQPKSLHGSMNHSDSLKMATDDSSASCDEMTDNHLNLWDSYYEGEVFELDI